MIVLLCIDLAMKLHSPSSADAKRALANTVLDEALEEMDYRNANSCRIITTTTATTDDSSSVEKEKEEEDYHHHPIRSTTKISSSSSSSSSTTKTTIYPKHYSTCYEVWEELIQTITKKDIATRLSTKYNGESYHSLHQLSRNMYCTDDLTMCQFHLFDRLDYYLHPVTFTSFICSFLELIKMNEEEVRCTVGGSNRNYDEKTESGDESLSSYFETINDYANMQVELAIFDTSLVLVRPSILAFCAMQNAIIQHTCNSIELVGPPATPPTDYHHRHYYENNDASSSGSGICHNVNIAMKHSDTTTEAAVGVENQDCYSSHDQFGILTKAIQEKLWFINFEIGEKILKLKPSISNCYLQNNSGALLHFNNQSTENDMLLSELAYIRNKLLNLWKKNNPKIVTIDKNSILMDCIFSQSSPATMFEMNDRCQFIPIDTAATTNMPSLSRCIPQARAAVRRAAGATDKIRDESVYSIRRPQKSWLCGIGTAAIADA